MEAAQCLSVDEWVKQLWEIYTMEYYSALKKKKLPFITAMDGPGEHYAQWNMPVRGREIPYDFTHMWSLMNKLNKENGDRFIDEEQDDS